MEQKPSRPVLTPPPAKAKPNLTPPPVPRSISQDARPPRPKLLFILAFAVAAIGAIGVVVILPELITQPTGTPKTRSEVPNPDKPLPVPQTTETFELQAEAKVEAETLLRGVLQHQARLENGGVKIWGNEKLVTSYSDALAKVSAANSYLDARRFDLAAKNYSETLSLFNQLEISRPDRLRNALRTGKEALERLDDETAQTRFGIALSLDPGNSPAMHGLKRARNLRQVIDRIQQGQAFESNGEFAQAKRAYAEAIARDEDYQPARDRLRQINELILTRDYQRAMSAASAALERKEYVTAQGALDRAARLRPNAPEVRNISQKVQEARQLAALERIRRNAAQHEEAERWEQALQAYEQALHIDKNTNFAIRGKIRSEKLFQLNQQVDYYLTNPDRLQSPDPLAHARKLLVVTNAIPNVGANLSEKLGRLRILVDGVSTPRPVILRSDEETDVTLYQVGRFGQFSERRMMLRPGEYTAVGSRTGYRDVRIRFRVPPSGEETTVVIRCEERL